MRAKLVVPRLGAYAGAEKAGGELRPLDATEKRGLRKAIVVLALFAAVVLWGVVPEGGYLRHLKTGGVLHSPS